MAHDLFDTPEHEAFRETGWKEAIDRTTGEIRRIQGQYGRDAFAIVSTGQIMTEEFYTLGKLARGVIGTNNYDGNTTLCMSSAVSGYKRSFGSDGPPGLTRGPSSPKEAPRAAWTRGRSARSSSGPVRWIPWSCPGR